VRIQHSYQNRVPPAFFADPAIRLHAVLAASSDPVEASICGDSLEAAPDFSKVLTQVAERIRKNLLPGCIPAPLTNRDNPDCVVGDVSIDDDGVEHVAAIPRGGLAGGRFPCWLIEEKPLCKDSSPESLGVTIERNGMMTSPDTYARVFCSTLAR